MRAAADAAAEVTPEEGKVVTRTRITADGTYATESSYVAAVAVTTAEKPMLRRFLLEGDFFVATALAGALTKMAMRYQQLDVEDKEKNAVRR